MRFAPFALATLCALVLFVGLDRVAPLDVREARDTQVARETLARREVLAPLYGQELLPEKPLLGYAHEIVARRLFPDSPVRSRQIRAALAVALVLLTASVAARHFGVRAAWFSAAVLATCVGLPLAARADGTQLLATLLGWAGCAGLADVAFGRSAGRDLRLLVTYGTLGAVIACAGPLPGLWPLAALALYVWLARAPEGWKRARVVAGLVVMFAVALPWYAALGERYGGDFLVHVPFFPYGAGVRGSWLSGPLLAASSLVVDFFPWSALLPAAMLHAATWWHERRLPGLLGRTLGIAGADPVSRERREESAAHYFILCLFMALGPIVLYPNAPLTAALPALPSAAVLCGRFLDHLFEAPARLSRPLARSTLMLAVLGTVTALLPAFAGGTLREAAPDLRLLSALLFLSSWAPFLADFIGRPRLAGLLFVLPVAIGAPVVSLRVLPSLEGYLNARQAAEALNAVAPARAPLLLVGPPPPSLRLLARHNLVSADSLAADARRFPAADGQTYLAFPPSREHATARALGVPLEILLRTPSLVLARVRAG